MHTAGFCNLTLVPVRAEASDRSEMVNQLLFGETFTVIESFPGWKLIRGTFDNYEGYIDEKQYLPLLPYDHEHLKSLPPVYPRGLLNYAIDEVTGTEIAVLPGSSLQGLENGVLTIGSHKFRFMGNVMPMVTKPDRKAILATAREYLGSPYLWGGRSPFGIDCSGLTQVVFKMHGIRLNRDSAFQAKQGETINLLSEAQPGDLAFFDNAEGNIAHVGILVEEGHIIHAKGKVRMDRIDHHGIYNQDFNKYTHTLRLIKRVLPG